MKTFESTRLHEPFSRLAHRLRVQERSSVTPPLLLPVARRVSRPNSTPVVLKFDSRENVGLVREPRPTKLPLHSVTDLIQYILENLIDGYDTDFISVSSDRVDTRSPRALSARD